ncbi:hypothetical protein AALA98_04055 [Lachnospiraceae bacterium 45-W7]
MKLDFLKKVAVKLERKNNAVFTYPVKKQKEYLDKLKEPYNDVDRSYCQYCCQMQFNGRVMTILLNVLSLPLLVYYYMKKTCLTVRQEKYDAVFFSEGIPEHVIPDSLREEFAAWLTVGVHGEYFSKKDRKHFKHLIKKYPLSWHFLLKCLIKIRFYSYEINIHSPKAIIVCGEYSFTSSVLTDYCAKNDVLHINVMHGEKLFFMRDSFFRFDRCYVWDEHYVKLFTSLKASQSQFIIELPPSLKFSETMKRNIEFDYTYYLASESETVLQKIAEVLEALKNKGYRISLRPHPRYSDKQQVIKYFSAVNIEDVSVLSIEESIMRTGHVVSLSSTVLNQALHNSIPIVIDNVSNPENYKKLGELGYICLNKEHETLSQLIKRVS